MLFPDLSRLDRDLDVGFSREAATAAQFGRALITSPPAPAFETGAAVARPLLGAPRNVRSDGTLRRSSAGARVPYPSFVGILVYLTIATDATGAARLLAFTQDNIP